MCVRFIVTEYLPHDLFDVCSRLGPMSEEAGKLFLNSVISVLDELHTNGNSHGDLKLENIMLDKNFNMKLIDFGFASQKNINSLTLKCGTLQYMAPEILEEESYQGDKADLFAVGVILFMIVSGRPPYVSKASEEDLYFSQLVRGNSQAFFELHEL